MADRTPGGAPDRAERFAPLTIPVAGGLRGPRHIAVVVCEWCGAILADQDLHARIDCAKFEAGT
jgi:hypothetical protein